MAEGRFAKLRELVPPPDAAVLWVETADEDLHFVDAVFASLGNLANVRREYHEEKGRKFFKIYVAPDLVDEALFVLDRLRRFVYIGEIRSDEASAAR